MLHRAPRKAAAELHHVDPVIERRLHQRVLGSRAVEPDLLRLLVGLLDLGLAAKAHDRQQHAEPVIVLRPEHRLVLVEEHIAVPTAHAIPQRHRIQRHRPVGEGSGLVEANDIHGRERLERLEPPHQDVVSPQILDAQRERGRGDHGQSLRDRRYGDRKRRANQLEQREASHPAKAEDGAARGERDPDELLSQLAELPLQWRLRRHRRPNETLDASDLGACARRHDDRTAAAAGHDRAAINHVHAVPKGNAARA